MTCEFCDDEFGVPPHIADPRFSRVELVCESAVALDTKKVTHTMALYDMDRDESCAWSIRFCPFCGRDLREGDE